MNTELLNYFKKIKKGSLTPEREKKLRMELNGPMEHGMPYEDKNKRSQILTNCDAFNNLYHYTSDLNTLQAVTALDVPYTTSLKSLDELLERDKQREKDGFPRKIRVGRLVKPGKGIKSNVVIVPTTVEEKLIHDTIQDPSEGESSGGAGDGDEGEIIGEQPIHDPDAESGEGPGEGEGGPHELESNAYDLGKILTEKFSLPNLKEKGKKRSLSRYTYDMTDKHRGFGQILDKKATLRKIVETNISLGNIPDLDAIDTTQFLIAPHDKIYRILSREKDYESQAVVFFVRDYSGSMAGKCTALAVAQHVLIYSWLLYQYAMQVETRFILHDTEAKEVKDFYTYYNSKVAGGTKVASGYRLVNEIVVKENLAKDYNIYLFHGTDGDDWDTDGRETLPELEKIMKYTNRVGITIIEHGYGARGGTEVEKYLKRSGLLKSQPKLLRLDVIQEDAEEPRLIEGIKKLISE